LTRSPVLSGYIVGWTIAAAIYFCRWTTPIEEMMASDRKAGVEDALAAAHGFPIRFWVMFLLHKVLGPPAILLAAWHTNTFAPTRIDLIRTGMVAAVMAIVVGFAIFFLALDRLGRAFEGVDIHRAQVTIKTKVFLLAALSPLLIDTALVQYYWTKTGHFTTETFLVWLFLELLAIGGALLFLRSLNQSLFPLEQLIASDGVPDPELLSPRSTDELGVLTTRYRTLLRGLTLQRSLLALRAELLAAEAEGGESEIGRCIVDAAVKVTGWDDAVMLVLQPDDTLVPVAAKSRSLDDHLRQMFANSTLAKVVLERRETLLMKDASRDPRAHPAISEALDAKAALVAPLVRRGETLGVLGVLNKHPVEDVRRSEMEAVEALADEAAAALARLRDHHRGRELETQLLRAQRLESVGRLAGGVAHDFNNVLAAIVATADLAVADATGTVREDLMLILDAAKRGSALTQQLLTFSRRGRVEPVDLSVNQVIKGLHPMLERLIPESIAFGFELCADEPLVRADPAEVEQIVMNLVVNARDAVDGEGHIDVTTRISDDGSSVLLEVRDDGQGMSQAVIDQIFDHFFSTKEQEKGTGLGLATVYGVVSRLGGAIDVASVLGEGACFTVSLPISASPERRKRHASSATEAGEMPQATVLLAEDDPTLRQILARALRHADLEVLEARDGVEALEVADTHDGPIDVLLTDMVMPRMKGPELADQLSKRRPEVKTMLMSGYADEDLWASVAGAGYEVLRKPFLPSELQVRLRAMLAPVAAQRRRAPRGGSRQPKG
jgi:signal transduction histidine kinase/CheY-like chemotaxis protein/NADH:ubiquinone oxidoreductase subunit 3 (subunit A)